MPYIGLGVKYIKIARYDANGNDNYVSLRELKKVRIKTNDAGIIEYPIATITEYPTYFLYQTVTTNITSSTNNQILNYQVSASNLNGTIGVVSGNPGIFTSLFATSGDIFPTINTNILGYLNPNNGIYTPGNTPNIPIIFSASLAVTASNFVMTASLGVFGGNNFDTLLLPTASFFFDPIDHALDPILYPKSSSLKIEGLIYPIEGQRIILKNLYNNSEPASWGDLRLTLLTQSFAPNPGIGAQTILEPYITTPFINSDYNAIINNASENRLSKNFMDVDYADNPHVPINLLALVSESATPAQVQDSNYTTQRVISSRYIGRQLQSAKFNTYTGPGYFRPGDIAFGKTPNVSNPSTYFLEFNWLAGLAPDYNGKVYASIKNLVDENGNKIKVKSDDEISMGILKQAFNQGTTNTDIRSLQLSPALATIKLADAEAFGSNMSSLNKTVYIDKIGKFPRPIIYSQVPSGSGPPMYGHTGSISFIDGNQPDTITISNTANDYTMKALAYGSPSTPEYYTILSVVNNIVAPSVFPDLGGSPYEIQFNAPVYLGQSASFATSSGTPSTGSRYKPTGSLVNISGSYSLEHKIELDLGWDVDGVRWIDSTGLFGKIYYGAKGGWIGFGFLITLEKSIDGGATWDSLPFQYNDSTYRDLNTWDTVPGGDWRQATVSGPGDQLSHGTSFYEFVATKDGKTPHRFVKIYYRDTKATTFTLYRIKVTGHNRVYSFDYEYSTAPTTKGLSYYQSNIEGNGSARIWANTSTWQVSQFTPPPGKDVGYYWVTGSRPNILHAQRGFSSFGNLRGLNDVYGQRQVDIKYDDSLYFLPIIEDFQLQPNDEIRFENLESQTYVITQISQSITTTSVAGTYNALTLVLDRDVPNTVNINYFLIRRWVDDAQIILGTGKPAGQTSTGVLIPEYVTDKTKEIIDNILPAPST